jgi:hypothetical protein
MEHKLLDTVALAHDLPDKGLRAGDLGVVVEVYESDGLEVELVTASGRTEALVTLKASDVRRVGDTTSSLFANWTVIAPSERQFQRTCRLRRPSGHDDAAVRRPVRAFGWDGSGGSGVPMPCGRLSPGRRACSKGLRTVISAAASPFEGAWDGAATAMVTS